VPLPNLFEHRSHDESIPVTFQAIGLGAIAGLRSMAAPALLSRAVRRDDLEGLAGSALYAALDSPKASRVLQLLMVGEMIADKTPVVPSRTSVPALLGRVLSGALVGSTLFVCADRPPVSGAALGGTSAIAAAYIGETFRVKGSEKLGVPDLILGLVEDGIVLLGGTRLLRRKD
jgi:uncharacterized membrane protein